ncbi:MAG: DNA alkylation repair protein [Lachnospiraceae bacterium]|nr:DNA alkylation repair protein [Lachnospiraceae bacterium]
MQNERLEEIRTHLIQAAEEDYRSFAAGLLPGTEGILGVRLPKLRKLAVRYAKACGTELLSQMEQSVQEGRELFFEERLLWGMSIGYLEMEAEERKRRLLSFLPQIDNWSVCDSCCITYKFMKEEPVLWWEFIRSFFQSQKEFEVRFGVVCGLDFFIREEFLDAFLTELEQIRHPAYYAQMAQAWALSMCYAAYPEQTEKVIAGRSLSDMVQNKTIQKIRESHQVEKAAKERLLQYRKGV